MRRWQNHASQNRCRNCSRSLIAMSAPRVVALATLPPTTTAATCLHLSLVLVASVPTFSFTARIACRLASCGTSVVAIAHTLLLLRRSSRSVSLETSTLVESTCLPLGCNRVSMPDRRVCRYLPGCVRALYAILCGRFRTSRTDGGFPPAISVAVLMTRATSDFFNRL